MKRFSRYLPFALFGAFFLLGLAAFVQSKPSDKNARIYAFVQRYSPYYLQECFGGLEIRSKEDEHFKEKPANTILFQTFESLEKQWGSRHLRIENNAILAVYDDNKSKKAQLPIYTPQERHFIERYYGVNP